MSQPPDPIIAHPEYARVFAHYVQHVSPDDAHQQAYDHTLKFLAAQPMPGQAPAGQPNVIVNNAGPRSATIGLTPGLHIMHLCLTLVTFGCWSPIWIIHAIVARRRVTV